MKKANIFGLISVGLLIASVVGFISLVESSPTNKIIAHADSTPPTIVTSGGEGWTFLQTIPNPEVTSGPFSEIKVGLYTYKVSWYDSEFSCGGTPSFGCTSPSKLTIQIDKGTPSMVTRNTVLHELIHACDALDVPHFGHIELGDEERAYRSPILLAALRENPKLAKFLLEEK